MDKNSFIKSSILIAREDNYETIDYQEDLNIIVNKYLQFYPTFISLQTTFLNMQYKPSDDNILTTYPCFSFYHSESELKMIQHNHLTFNEILDQTKDFEILTLLFQTIKGIRDHCIRKLQEGINPILKLLVEFNINSWVLPNNLHRGLFLQIVTEFPFYEILHYGNEYTFLYSERKENFRFIYHPKTGIIEIISKRMELLN